MYIYGMRKKKKTLQELLKDKTFFSGKYEKEEKVILNMTFEEAMKKALNTPLPEKDKPKK